MKPLLVLLCLAAAPALAQPVLTQTALTQIPRVAVFDFDLLNTSPAPSTPDEIARLHRLDDQLHQALAVLGRYQLVDTAAVRDQLARVSSIRGCNGCERGLARTAGAELAAYGWVQKVSNLILNINLVIEDATTGAVLKADSVDIRGNTDESWQRGLRYLINERLFRD